MEISKHILEYLQLLLSPQIVIGAVTVTFLLLFREDIKALLLRIAKIKLPGGAEVSTPQSEQQAEEETQEKPAPTPDTSVSGLPSGLTAEQRTTVENMLKAERATSYLWEYRYLNHYLVYGTQRVLDWIISLGQPTTYSHYDATWLPLIPSSNERNAILNALQQHHLIQESDGAITVTPKGIEYQQWRGELPPLTNT